MNGRTAVFFRVTVILGLIACASAPTFGEVSAPVGPGEIVWRSIKGPDSPMPAPVRAAFIHPVED